MIWVLTLLVTVLSYVANFIDSSEATNSGEGFRRQFLILSSIVVLSLPYPIGCFVHIRRTITEMMRTSSNISISSGGQRKLNANEQKFLRLCVRSFVLFTVCWTPYAVFGFVIFFDAFPERFAQYTTEVQYFVHITAFLNSTLNPILFLQAYSFGSFMKLFWKNHIMSKLSINKKQPLNPTKERTVSHVNQSYSAASDDTEI